MLHTRYRLVLASGSPRRQQFFNDLDLAFEIRLKEVDETYPDQLKGAQITEFLSILKADAQRDTLADDEMLVTSDTIVWHQGKALGKPVDFEHAVSMLASMQGHTHEVITSVCFTTVDRQEVLTETTAVTFAALSETEIRYYLEKWQPIDKAGAYGIQDWIGLTAITKIEGSYTNVVGLPTHRVYEYLKQHAL